LEFYPVLARMGEHAQQPIFYSTTVKALNDMKDFQCFFVIIRNSFLDGRISLGATL